jgi:hypothetical protein
MNEITTPQTLQERVGARIREQIGDLLTDDDLKKLVDTALAEAFFKRRTRLGDYGRVLEDKDALLVETVRELLKPAVDKAAAAWVAANTATVQGHIDDAIGRGLIGFMQQWFDQRMSGDFYQFGESIKKALGVGQ